MNENKTVFKGEKVVVANSAFLAISLLPNEDRSVIFKTLASLAASYPTEWPTDKVHRQSSREGLYVLDANDQLRVFFQRENDGTLTIVDVANQETLDRYFSTPIAKE